MYRTILVPLDGSPLAERSLPYAAAVARAAGARLRLVRVVPEEGPPGATTLAGAAAAQFAVERLREADRGDRGAERPGEGGDAPPVGPAEYLEAVAGRLALPGTSTAVLAGEPAPEILREAHRAEAGLIAVATHGRSGLGR